MSAPRTRATRQKEAIRSALRRADRFLSAQELHERIRAAGERVGLTTVYRNLQSLGEDDEVDVLRRRDGELTFRRCDSEHHHHHLICRGCGYSVEVDDPDVEKWAERVGRRNGFSELSHDLEIFGLCTRCS